MRSGMSVGSALTFSSRVTCSSTPPSLTPGATSTPSISSGDHRFDLLVQAHLQQVDVQHLPAHRVPVLVLDDHGLAAAAVDLDVEQRVPLGEHPAQAARVDLERDGIGAGSVDHAGHEAVAAQPPVRPRAALLARAERQQGSLSGCHQRRILAVTAAGSRGIASLSAMADDPSDRSIPKSRLGPLGEARHARGRRGRAVRRHQGGGCRALQGEAARADGRNRAGVRRAPRRHARHDEGRRDEDGAARLLHRHRLPARGVPRAVPGEARRRFAPRRRAMPWEKVRRVLDAGVRRALRGAVRARSSPRRSRPPRSARCTGACCTTGARWR